MMWRRQNPPRRRRRRKARDASYTASGHAAAYRGCASSLEPLNHRLGFQHRVLLRESLKRRDRRHVEAGCLDIPNRAVPLYRLGGNIEAVDSLNEIWRVTGTTTPSTPRRLATWNARTAASVELTIDPVAVEAEGVEVVARLPEIPL